jgi:fatty acid desaturase
MPNSFSGTKRTKPMQQQPIPSLWPSIVVFACVAIVAAGALALIGWIALALLGY